MLAELDRHPHARAVLGAALRPGGRASHAYLFHGPAGSGKRAAARAFAAALLSVDPTTPDPSVAERVARDAHPDLTWVRPGSVAGILVADIDRQVIAAATRTPFEAPRRVFVIEAADELNEQAANRLLKTLEEPGSHVHLILVASRLDDVLPTVRSRCQPVRFDARDQASLAEFLSSRGLSPATADACARLCLGDADRALALGLGSGPSLRAAAEALARAILADDISAAPWLALLGPAQEAGREAEASALVGLEEFLEMTPKKERKRVQREREEVAQRAQRRARTEALHQALGLVGIWLRDVACVIDGAPEVIFHTDRADGVAEDAKGRRSGPIRSAMDVIDVTRASLVLNPGEELALEAMTVRAARVVQSA